MEAIRAQASNKAAQWLSVAEDADAARESLIWSSSTGSVQYPVVLLNELFRITGSLDQPDTSISDARSAINLVTSGSTGTAVGLTLNLTGIPPVVPPSPRLTSATELDALLGKLWGNQDLVIRRKEAWLALQRATPEACAQACHSQREILTAILDTCAPPKEVMSAPWWKADPALPGKVSKRDKVTYLVVRAAKHLVTPAVLEELDAEVTTALAAHAKAIALAHGNDTNSLTAGKAAMVALDAVILTLLCYRMSAVPGARFSAA